MVYSSRARRSKQNQNHKVWPTRQIVDSMDYLPFGEQIAGGSTTTHKFTGKERDSESGLDEFGARYYSSTLGRFTIPDWAANATAVPYANFGNPQSLNLYSYAENNPTTFGDPDGHCTPQTPCSPADVPAPAKGDFIEQAKGLAAQLVVDALGGAGVSTKFDNADQEKGASYALFVETAVPVIAGELGAELGAARIGTLTSTEGGAVSGGTSMKEIVIDGSKYPESAQHAADAQAAGHPDVVTIDRQGASARRGEALKGTSTTPKMDRDEYPPAFTREGGAGASRRSIPQSDNRGAGASMGAQARGVPDGTKVRIVPKTKPTVVQQ